MAAVSVGLAMGSLRTRRLALSLRKLLRVSAASTRHRKYSSDVRYPGVNFGLMFDIDGVIVRAGKLLPKAKEAFRLLTNEKGEFWVPTIFVTNAGNTLRANKAQQLSDWLDVEVGEDQVLMSHSPLKMFRQFFDKHILVSGQGPTKEIASNLGFTSVTTIETLRQCFPTFDMVDHKRRKNAACGFEKYFPRIEAVVLFGEPIRWETNLQLILDVLVTNGLPNEPPDEIPYPHVPILACNMDLMWMADAVMPRFAHGCFLHCLESLYQKITGHTLKYTALVGKPSEITYHHSENVLQTAASQMGLSGLKRMYCIGDNPDVDIYGSNLFNRTLQRRRDRLMAQNQKEQKQMATAGSTSAEAVALHEDDEGDGIDTSYSTDDLAANGVIGLEKSISVLVCTGVYNDTISYSRTKSRLLDHNHRDFIMDPELKKPDMMVLNVYDSVQAIFKKEGLS